MKILAVSLALLATIAAPSFAQHPRDAHGLGQRLVNKLAGRHARAPRPQSLSTTDFAGQTLGCITLERFEMRDLGYPGHAFLCESDASGEALGAVQSRSGRVVCHISGDYVGDDCYELSICGASDTLCVR